MITGTGVHDPPEFMSTIIRSWRSRSTGTQARSLSLFLLSGEVLADTVQHVGCQREFIVRQAEKRRIANLERDSLDLFNDRPAPSARRSIWPEVSSASSRCTTAVERQDRGEVLLPHRRGGARSPLP